MCSASAASPTSQTRHGQTLLRRKHNNTTRELTTPKLGMCMGDCHGMDRNCQLGLSCSSPTNLNQVPECHEDNDSAAAQADPLGASICYAPPPGVLVHVGGHHGVDGTFHPPAALPLEKCQGSCKTDSDCRGTLQCWKRTTNEPIPGCTGRGIAGLGYCHEALLTIREAVPSAKSGLGHCEGNCSANDSACLLGLSCFVRSRREPVPGCAGRGVRTAHYCYKPPPGVLVHIGDRDTDTSLVTPPHADFPLGKCQGNCNDDSDCQADLVCLKPNQDNSPVVIPGCNSTTGIRGMGYCHDPSTSMVEPTIPLSQPPTTVAPTTPAPTTLAPTSQPPTLKPTTMAPTRTMNPTSFPQLIVKGGEASVLSLDVCEGDCVGDDVLCKYGLSCFNRNGIELVPGCNGQGFTGASYCWKPPPDHLVYMGEVDNDDQPNVDSHDVFPLEECQGDCDEDWECRPGLLCFFREDYEPVPGCNGRGVQGRDYCYNPRKSVASPSSSQESTTKSSSDDGGGKGMSHAAVISIIVSAVVLANICLCVTCKWLLSRDPATSTKQNKDSKKEPPPPLEADGGILIKSVKEGAGVNAQRVKKVGFVDSNEEFERLDTSTLNPATLNYHAENSNNEIT